MGFIYKITNQINKKIYIGKTIFSITHRFNQHLWESFNSKCNGYNFILHKAIRKYGKENFKIELIEEFSNELLDEREQYWIEKLNSKIPYGYNMTLGGEGALKYDRLKIIKMWEEGLSTQQIIESCGICFSTLKQILTQYNLYNELEDKQRRKLVKKVYQYSQYGELIKIHDSIQAAANSVEVDRSIISRCCNGEKKSSKGYIWSLVPIDFSFKEIKKWKKRRVIQKDLQGNIINIYDTMVEAGKAMNKKNTKYIKECCDGLRESMYNYIWQYENEYVDSLAVKGKMEV